MSRSRRTALLLAVLSVAAVVRTPAQQPEPVPEPYTPEEFSVSMHALRRAEIVAVGAFPFTLLFSILVYDYARWGSQGFGAEDVPFRRSAGEDPFTDDEKVGIAIGAAVAAVAVAVADYLLGGADAVQPPESDTPTTPARARLPAGVPHSHAGVLPVSLATVMHPASVSARP